jgi:hypothetical protein
MQVLSRDSVTVSVDAVVYYRVKNPIMATNNVEDYRLAPITTKKQKLYCYKFAKKNQTPQIIYLIKKTFKQKSCAISKQKKKKTYTIKSFIDELFI